MIVFFGPAGAGKSMQGQMLAARHHWRWLSTGQLLRDTKNPEVLELLQTGDLASDELIGRVLGQALEKAQDIERIILDGFPRNTNQANWLIDEQEKLGRKIDLAIVLEVPRAEIAERLRVRGRADDTPEVIDARLNIYRKEIYPILNLLSENNIPIAHVHGVGTVGQVHDAIEAELEDRGVVSLGG